MPATSAIRTIAIVGCGLSAALTVTNIIKIHPRTQIRLIWIGREARFGRGLAYGTSDDNLLLNVPAGNMSAFPNEPDHFLKYCQSIDPSYNAGSFLSRRVYGDYLEATLQKTIADNTQFSLRTLLDEVVSVRKKLDSVGYILYTRSGVNIVADQVVLALGHFPPQDPAPVSDFYAHSAYISNPWGQNGVDCLNKRGNVVALLGAGHTAIDTAFRLASGGHVAKIFMISRRGLRPQSHRPNSKSPNVAAFPKYFEDRLAKVRAYCKALRLEVETGQTNGIDWRDTMNQLRPYVPKLWQLLPLNERQRFISKLAPYWDVHRHRLAPSAHFRLTQMIKHQQVEIIQGRIVNYRVNNGLVEISLRERRAGDLLVLHSHAVINCTGPSYDITKINDPLVTQLYRESYIRQDPTRLGIEVNDRYQIMMQSSAVNEGLFYIGPMLKARFWESTAVPELRLHAKNLAQILCG